MKDILIRGLSQMGIMPPPGAVEKLCLYARLLLEQNKVMNLTAITQPEGVARLHFLDSAAVLTWGNERGESHEAVPTGSPAKPQALLGKGETTERETLPACPAAKDAPTWLSGKSLVDVGTGAGFPGLVLKILEPSLSLTLVDSLGKRVAWLEAVCKALSLNGVQCIHARGEELALEADFRDRFDVSTSRAVAAFPALCELCLPYVHTGGVFLAMKSVDSGAEIACGLSAVQRLGGKAPESWDYSIPEAGVSHRIVSVQKLSPTPKGLPRSWGKIKKSPL